MKTWQVCKWLPSEPSENSRDEQPMRIWCKVFLWEIILLTWTMRCEYHGIHQPLQAEARSRCRAPLPGYPLYGFVVASQWWHWWEPINGQKSHAEMFRDRQSLEAQVDMPAAQCDLASCLALAYWGWHVRSCSALDECKDCVSQWQMIQLQIMEATSGSGWLCT